MRSLTASQFSDWKSLGGSGHVASISAPPGMTFECMALCYDDNKPPTQAALRTVEDCNKATAPLHSFACRSASLIDQVLIAAGNSDDAAIQFQGEEAVSQGFILEGLIPQCEPGAGQVVRGEIFIQIAKQHIVNAKPVQIVGQVDLYLRAKPPAARLNRGYSVTLT